MNTPKNTQTASAPATGSALPAIIWLQWHGAPAPFDAAWSGGTWSKEKVFDHDVEYVRNDEMKRLRECVDCAVNALTDSIQCSGNDAETNLHFVRKLRSLIASPNTKDQS